MMTTQLAIRWQAVGVICLLGLGGCSKQTTPPTVSLTANTVAVNTAAATGRQALTRPFEFDSPTRMHTAEGPVRVDIPGYAAPCWADVNDDGKKDLLVGQFNGGKIRVYENLGDQKFAEGEWLRADGEVAKVPGVW